ncbi:ROK family transcriptional regulator [Modestobacter sp. L9-4]|uniref:ROK family transcriptional regulator n=1 Tax=Modestobacter sp. L9-4 TaxID=2851567 RepID=UPI001C73E3E6|nr:ROK family transcriptional regulator [Modestobacter sp. L9-4]QXG76519.1 ROK family transcriptional regulator [Modestobacter sp. L9-4]
MATVSSWTPDGPSWAPSGLVAPDSPGAVLQLVRTGHVSSRSEIARLTGISATTAATRVQALLDHGYLEEAGEGVSHGGRRPRQVRLRSAGGVVAAADLGGSHAALALFDLGGRLLAERSASIRVQDGPESVLGWVHGQLVEMLAGLDGPAPLHAVTVGVPGPVDAQAGRVVTPARMPGWNGVDVRALLGRLVDVPVLVENDANLMAVGEYAATPEPGRHLVFLKAGSGIGCGVVIDGHLHRGARGAAGDISHASVGTHSDVPCSCGRIGCLDAVASGAALARDLAAAGLPVTDTADVLRLAADGEPVSAQLLRSAGRATGEVLANVLNFFNPDTLVLGGRLSQAEPWVSGLRAVVYERCLPLATDALQVTVTRAGPLAGVIGGAHLALEHLFEPTRVNAAVGAGPAA